MALIALVANILARVAIMLHPEMPKTTEKIAEALGFTINTESYKKYVESKELLADFIIKPTPPLFPKIEEPLMESESTPPPKEEKKKEQPKVDETPKIAIDDFFKAELKIGTILEAEIVEKSNKLLKLKVDLGEENPRQIIAGIREFYDPTNLINTQVCVVANLKPAKIMGMLSEGMVLASKDSEGLALLRPEDQKSPGSKVS